MRNGSSICLRLASEGATVAVSDSEGTRAQATVNVIGGGIAIEADASDPADCARAVKEAEAALDGLDVVVLNVGVPGGMPLRSQSVEDWDRTMSINARSHYLTIQAALDGMLERGFGVFVGVGSISAVVTGGRAVAYEASKAAQLAVIRHTAVRYGPRGIRANSVLLGFVDSVMAQSANNTASWRMTTPPLMRQGTPTDTAGAVSFLASDDAAYINGTELVVDGGVLPQTIEAVVGRKPVSDG
jgi:NAD(P)-dependent dehydrogenase (short-subunit alcohol dehydrogenase family)